MSVTAAPRGIHNPYTEAEITEGLMALIAWAGNASAAARSLEAQGKMTVNPATLHAWAREKHSDRYEELRSKYAEQLEGQLVHEYRDVARLAVEVQREALDQALTRLKGGKDQDPSRTAANAATVADKMTRNTLALSGRPTSIREDRNLNEVLRSLAAKGIIDLPPEDVHEALPAEVPGGPIPDG